MLTRNDSCYGCAPNKISRTGARSCTRTQGEGICPRCMAASEPTRTCLRMNTTLDRLMPWVAWAARASYMHIPCLQTGMSMAQEGNALEWCISHNLHYVKCTLLVRSVTGPFAVGVLDARLSHGPAGGGGRRGRGPGQGVEGGQRGNGGGGGGNHGTEEICVWQHPKFFKISPEGCHLDNYSLSHLAQFS